MEISKAFEELSKEKERKFKQTYELIINLKGLDLRRNNLSLVFSIPHKIKDKKVCGFLTKKSDLVDTVTKPEFTKYGNDPKLIRGLVKKYDFFIAHASLMPSVATTFGKALGPAGKMPSPQLGIITEENADTINPLIDQISKSVKIRAKELSIKVPVGKEGMDQKQIEENLRVVYKNVLGALPGKEDNIKNVLLKKTMSKPVEVELK